MTSIYLTITIAIIIILTAAYAVSSVRASAALRQAQKDRNDIYRNCFLNGLAGILAKMTAADGAVVASETKVAEKLFTDMGLSEDDRALCLATFRNALQNDLPGSYYASLFTPYSTLESRQLVYEVLWDIASADANFAPSEDKFLKELIKWLNLEPSAYERNLLGHKKRFAVVDEAVKAASAKLEELFH